MNARTEKLLQQAGKYLGLNKLTLALEVYLKVHEMEPQDTTIVNNIGDLYFRLDNKPNALKWYSKLAEKFELREQGSNAIAVYRKILKLSPDDERTIELLASLYVRLKQIQNAKSLYQSLAALKMAANDQVATLAIQKKICDLDPTCLKALHASGQLQERLDYKQDALESYLKAATICAQRNELQTAIQIAEDIFRLAPTDREYLKQFFMLLRKMNLAERGLRYLESLGVVQEPEFRVLVSEMLLEEGKLKAAQHLVEGFVTTCPGLYKPALRIFQELIAQNDLDGCMKMLGELFEASLRMDHETAFKASLDSLLELDPNNIRLLKMLTGMLVRMNDNERLEEYLQKLVLLQLRSEDFHEGLESLNKLVIYGKAGFTIDLFQRFKEAMATDCVENLRNTSLKVIQALENGNLDCDDACPNGLAVGVGEEYLRMAMGLGEQEYADLIK